MVSDVTCQVDPGLKALGFNPLIVHPFQSFGFRCQPAPLQRGQARRRRRAPRQDGELGAVSGERGKGGAG